MGRYGIWMMWKFGKYGKQNREGWVWKGEMGAVFGGFECQLKVFHKAVGNLGKLLGKGVI